MSGTLTQRLKNLSPAKRVLLEMKLKGKNTFVRDRFSISPRKNSGIAPLSFNQESLLFIERLNPDTSIYNIYEAVRLTGSLNLDAVQKAVDTISERHDSLRTAFTEIEGQARQIIAARQPVSIQVKDLRQSPSETRERLAIEMMTAEVNRPMDLRQGALFETTLVKMAEQEHFLLIKMHHIISDGWSMGVFWKEFTHLYQRFSQGRSFELPELPIQFGDYAVWSREQSEKSEELQSAYWKNQLQTAPALLELPADRARPAVQSTNGAQEIGFFATSLRDRLKKISQQENATLYMTLLAAFNVLLARYTGREDLIVGSPVSGETRPKPRI